jgi:hypothetical protein
MPPSPLLLSATFRILAVRLFIELSDNPGHKGFANI